MKTKTSLILLLALATLVSAGAAPARLARLTVVNKSGRAVEIRLTGVELGASYYLHVPLGIRESPQEQVFTVVRDRYSSTLYYVELWDPVYGYSCASKSQTLDLVRNVKVIVLECDRRVPNRGESPSLIKYGGGSGHIQPR